MAERRGRLFASAGWRPPHGDGPAFTCTDYRVFATACLPGLPGPASETALAAFRRALEGTLASAGAIARRLAPDELLSLAAELAAPDIAGSEDGGLCRPARRWSPRDPLHAQCAAPGRALRRNSTLAAASGPLKEQAPVNVNYAWRAVKASAFVGADQALAEFAMSVSGTVIVTAPVSDGDTSGPRVRILEPLALDRRVTEVLMEGGGDLPVYRCDAPDECLNPTLGRVTIPADLGFRGRVAGLLRDLVDAVRADTAPPAGALGLVNLTTLPVYRVINAAASYRGAVIDQEVDALAEAVALDVLQVWIADLHRTVEERAGALDIADAAQLDAWREGLRANRIALARHRNEGLERFNTALSVVEKLRLIETELAGALSADLRAALAFSRGGAAAAGQR